MVGWHHRLDGQEFEQAWTEKPSVSIGWQRVEYLTTYTEQQQQ